MDAGELDSDLAKWLMEWLENVRERLPDIEICDEPGEELRQLQLNVDYVIEMLREELA
jgi:hypothetical protein